MDSLEVVDLEYWKDKDLHMSIKNAFQLHYGTMGESYLLCARKPAEAVLAQSLCQGEGAGFSITKLQREQAMLNASKQQAPRKPKALRQPCYLMHQEHLTLLTSLPQQQVLVMEEPK
uniref:Uncharacterized protein n=1 Tax=Myotis myotis TaxID=51298 RepID=A0A7J7Z0B7_MYOMY|nr:hypothetical protein mMyoMyo1_000954 [Myotis myotis]